MTRLLLTFALLCAAHFSVFTLQLSINTMKAQTRRPIDNEHPLWMIHIDVWNGADRTESTTIYDLSGRKVERNHMPKGIYIQNGKKFMVK